jgi:hypothetical protein
MSAIARIGLGVTTVGLAAVMGICLAPSVGTVQARGFLEQAVIDLGNGIKAITPSAPTPAPAPTPPAPKPPMGPCTRGPNACDSSK